MSRQVKIINKTGHVHDTKVIVVGTGEEINLRICSAQIEIDPKKGMTYATVVLEGVEIEGIFEAVPKNIKFGEEVV